MFAGAQGYLGTYAHKHITYMYAELYARSIDQPSSHSVCPAVEVEVEVEVQPAPVPAEKAFLSLLLLEIAVTD